MELAGDISFEGSSTVLWKIRDFFTLMNKEKLDKDICSPFFSYRNNDWIMKIITRRPFEKPYEEWICLIVSSKVFRATANILRCGIRKEDGNLYSSVSRKEFYNGSAYLISEAEFFGKRSEFAPTSDVTFFVEYYSVPPPPPATTLATDPATTLATNPEQLLTSNKLQSEPETENSDLQKAPKGWMLACHKQRQAVGLIPQDYLRIQAMGPPKSWYPQSTSVMPYCYTNMGQRFPMHSVYQPPSDASSNSKSTVVRITGPKDLSSDFGILSQHLRDLYVSGKESDMAFQVGDRKFQVHKLILGARSSVFAAMIHHDVKEDDKTVDVIDCEADDFHEFLLYLYSGRVEKLSTDNAVGLYTLADKYMVDGLKLKCIDHLKKNMNVDIFCSAADLAVRHEETEFLKYLKGYFTKNAKKIISSPYWNSLMKENTTLASELFLLVVSDCD